MRRFSEWMASKWQRPENLEDERKAADLDVAACFGTAIGRRVLDRLLSEHYCTVSHVPGGRCCDSAFNEGQRSVVHEILESLERAEKNLYGGTDRDYTDATGN
jgi:hypothetical protein